MTDALTGLDHWRSLAAAQQPEWPDPAALRAAAAAGLPEGARRLLVRPYGPGDPLG